MGSVVRTLHILGVKIIYFPNLFLVGHEDIRGQLLLLSILYVSSWFFL